MCFFSSFSAFFWSELLGGVVSTSLELSKQEFLGVVEASTSGFTHISVQHLQRYHTDLEADHIQFIINHDKAGVYFDVLYDNIFQCCKKQMRSSSIEKIDHISMGI
ncbi:hypothetical protein O6H91_Y193900 [Diphasiastrum complanatum]|nr:hypothetical protein O6H91_Y193900 [Diphasiastrum complanatum]